MSLDDAGPNERMVNAGLLLAGVFAGYAVMALCKNLLAGPARLEWAHSSIEMGARVSQAVAYLGPLKAAATELYFDRGEWPTPTIPNFPLQTTHPDFGRIIGSYTIGVTGQIRVRLAGPGLEGLTLHMAPIVQSHSGMISGWTCGSPDIPPAWLPEPCRN